MSETPKRCDTCARGWANGRGGIACGAGVDARPIWALRKYDPARIRALLDGSPSNADQTDCDDMPADDGASCEAWESTR